QSRSEKRRRAGMSVAERRNSALEEMFPNDEAHEESRLVAKAKSGCPAAFGQLYERNRLKIYRIVLRVVRRREDAEDAVQRCFERAMSRLPRFRGDSKFSTWITRIAINEALMLLRQRRASTPLSDSADEEKESPFVLGLADESLNPEE